MRKTKFWLCGMLLLGAAFASNADDRLLVQVPALLDPSAPIEDSVKRDCRVEGRVGDQVYLRVSESHPGAAQISDPAKAGPDRFLKVTILSVMGHGGGSWSGNKAMTIRVDVAQNAKVFASKTLSRQSGGGVLGGVSGTCAIMERIALALGKDVAKWLPDAFKMAPGPLPTTAPDPAPASAQPPKEEGQAPAVPEKPTETKQ